MMVIAMLAVIMDGRTGLSEIDHSYPPTKHHKSDDGGDKDVDNRFSGDSDQDPGNDNRDTLPEIRQNVPVKTFAG